MSFRFLKTQFKRHDIKHEKGKMLAAPKRKKAIFYNPSNTIVFKILVVLIMGFSIFLHVEASSKGIDVIAEEFSGPLSVMPEMITVGDSNNEADPLTGLGSVLEPFQIGKHDVTQLQWSNFLNAVHVVEGNLQDPRHLFSQEMFEGEHSTMQQISGIVKQRIQHEYDLEIYEEKVTLIFPKGWGTLYGHYYGSLPITGISIDDCKRYINWLHHGQPFFNELNEQTLAVTETGAYDFTNGKHGELMPNARYFIPTLNQWYKAAYHQAGKNNATSYWNYPTQGNCLPTQTPGAKLMSALNDSSCIITGANFASNRGHSKYQEYYLDAWYHLRDSFSNEEFIAQANANIAQPNSNDYILTTPVGAFKNSPGPYGTYDMGGNVRQWTSDVISTKDGDLFIAAGGSYEETSDQLLSNNAGKKSFKGSTRSSTIGLRVCAKENIDNQKPSSSDEQFVPDGGASLFSQQLGHLAFAQITSYALEVILDSFIKRGERGEWVPASELLRPFTVQRNIVNFILMFVVAAAETGETSAISINRADCWTVVCIITGTIFTMMLTEGSAFVVEAFVGKALQALGVAGIEDSVGGVTWARIFLNVYYIGFNTYYATESDLEYFNEQQKKLKTK